MPKRRSGSSLGAGRTKKTAAAASSAAAATAHARRSRFFLRETTTAGAPAFEPACAIQESSFLTSRALCQRSSGSLARQVATSRSRAGGDIAATDEIGSGSFDMIAVTSDAWLAPLNAFLPVDIS